MSTALPLQEQYDTYLETSLQVWLRCSDCPLMILWNLAHVIFFTVLRNLVFMNCCHVTPSVQTVYALVDMIMCCLFVVKNCINSLFQLDHFLTVSILCYVTLSKLHFSSVLLFYYVRLSHILLNTVLLLLLLCYITDESCSGTLYI